jgi:geranylgeranyl diphosphate synthase type II
VIGDEKKLGKKTLSDVKKQKLTYPSVLGLEKTRELAEIHTQKAISALEPFGEKAIPLRAMAEFVLKRVY